MTTNYDKLRCEYGKIEGPRGKIGFYYWFVGGKNFGPYAGDFEGPFDTLAIAKAKAEEIGRKEKIKVRRYTGKV